MMTKEMSLRQETKTKKTCSRWNTTISRTTMIMKEMSLRQETKSTITGWGGTEQSRWNITINFLFHLRARDNGAANQRRMQMRWYITICQTNEQTNNKWTIEQMKMRWYIIISRTSECTANKGRTKQWTMSDEQTTNKERTNEWQKNKRMTYDEWTNDEWTNDERD